MKRVPTILANPASDTIDAARTVSAVGPDGASGAQVQQALDDVGLSVNGAGIRVGVLSDSFDDLGGAAADEADGALPPASDIEVLKDLPSGGTDEGRAMMQIIHDVAPGASLAFYTADEGERSFANGILALAAAGCKVIVDDVGYFDEPFFQNGVIAQAIQTVEAEGVTYVTAAGNDASNAYQAAWTPISGRFDGRRFSDAESFGGSIDQTITLQASRKNTIPLLLEWNQPYGQATSDLKLFVFHDGTLYGTSTNRKSGEPNNPWLDFTFTASGSYQIVIKNVSGPNPGLIKEIGNGDGLPIEIGGANAGTVYGHSMTPGAISVGAVSVAGTPAFGVNPALSEPFSSSGAGTELLFANNGTPLSSPELLSPVVASGVDDIHTTVPRGLHDFYGTSAASASLAGVAALMLSANPDLSPAQVEAIMERSASPMADPTVSGAGLVRADVAVLLAEWTAGAERTSDAGTLTSFAPGANPRADGSKVAGADLATGASGMAQSLVGGTFFFKDADTTAVPTITVTPNDGGVGYIGSLTAAARDMANGHASVGWHFDVDMSAVSETVTQSYDVTVAEAQPGGPGTTATRSISVTVGGPSSDTFVFQPGFGTDAIANANTADKIELDGFSSVSSLRELHALLSEAQAGQSDALFHATHGGHDTVINLGNHDSIILANVHLANLHASNFIVR
jgi:Subtilase family